MGAWISLAVYMNQRGMEEMEASVAEHLDRDQALILERMRTYYSQNDKSLGPGGPILARESTGRAASEPTRPANETTVSRPPVNDGPWNGPPSRPRVSGVLELSHLVNEVELNFGSDNGTGMGWELVITGKASATLRARGWANDIVREISIQDIGQNLYAETTP
jgi:hypothetical protein